MATAHHPVTLSTAWWMAKNNLVVTAGPNTLVHQLTSASHLITNTLSTFLSHDASPLPITSHDNIKWSHLLINGIPTRVYASCGPYTSLECHQVLFTNNPGYHTLRHTQPLSWIRSPSTYSPSSVLSLVVAFEDPSGESLQSLLTGKTLFAFGHSGDLWHWKQKPHSAAVPSASA